MTVKLKWQDPGPPPTRNGLPSAFTAEVREALRARPGRWAVVHNSRHTSDAHLWKKRWAAEGFEFTLRRVRDADPKTYDVYARYNPEVDE